MSNPNCRLVNGYQLVKSLIGNNQPQSAKGNSILSINSVTQLEGSYNGLAYLVKLDTTNPIVLVDWGGIYVEVSGNPSYENIYVIPVNL